MRAFGRLQLFRPKKDPLEFYSRWDLRMRASGRLQLFRPKKEALKS
ncbi:uncharacterized protein G2W53_008472 [Senna tora]|uniref:Uncharacterized protein n=1 Tax=Senna tora TaxID=362788 RepID=A0A834X8J5_9FABA|nr:uncharacterized protein G2W53_008472 [Senna tora]